MSSIKRKSDRLTDEKRKEVINEIIYFFESERNEEIGHIAAEQILNFFLERIGPDLYNRGIEDSKTALQNRFEELKYDLDDLLDT